DEVARVARDSRMDLRAEPDDGSGRGLSALAPRGGRASRPRDLRERGRVSRRALLRRLLLPPDGKDLRRCRLTGSRTACRVARAALRRPDAWSSGKSRRLTTAASGWRTRSSI